MKLNYVKIGEYKNLKDFEFEFTEDSHVEVLVGKNGSGKSNFLESIVEIFQHLFELQNPNISIFYDYSIYYTINQREVRIDFKSGKLLIDGEISETVPKEILPDNVIIYYTGHNPIINGLLDQYHDSFIDRIKTAKFDETRKIIGIGPEYNSLFLTMMLLLPNENTSRKFLVKKLGIESIDTEIKIVLKRPHYAIGKSSFDVTSGDDEDSRYWKAAGITKDFLLKLNKCISLIDGELVRTEGYLADDDEYVHYLDIDKIKKEFFDITIQQLFRQFDNLKSISMLKDISIVYKTKDGIDLNLSNFSDGQFQQTYIYALLELFKDKNCLCLLDEPDAFLHPEWQFDSLEYLCKMLKDDFKNHHMLMTSHNATSILPVEKDKIPYFDSESKQHTISYRIPKKVAIRKLSNNLIKIPEEEQILSIINTIQIENKPILFTEGHTDPIILKEAWYKLYEEDIPFIPFYAFNCGFIKQLLTDEKIHKEMSGFPVFGLFDLDKAYNQWKDLNGNVIEDDYYKGKVKKWDSGDAYALILPLTQNDEIKNQVIKDEETMVTFEGESHYEIEHIFYSSEIAKKYFKTERVAGGKIISFISDNQKTKFAKEIVPFIEDECFETFKPMFEFIKATISQIKN